MDVQSHDKWYRSQMSTKSHKLEVQAIIRSVILTFRSMGADSDERKKQKRKIRYKSCNDYATLSCLF